MSLNGKVALVTGASRGLGVGAARALAKAGAKVMLVARDGSSCDGARCRPFSTAATARRSCGSRIERPVRLRSVVEIEDRE